MITKRNAERNKIDEEGEHIFNYVEFFFIIYSLQKPLSTSSDQNK